MKEEMPNKIYFEPSTIGNIDKSVLDYIENLNLRTETNEGTRTVPVMWGTSERSFISIFELNLYLAR